MSTTTDYVYVLVVIGAGTSGIAVARFYLEVHPNANVIISRETAEYEEYGVVVS